MKQRTAIAFLLLIACLGLSSCVSSFITTGATLIYDRHSVYKQVNDFQLGANAGRALYRDNSFKCDYCAIDIAAFNGDLLLAGHVPSKALRKEAEERIARLSGYRRVFIQLSIKQEARNTVEDTWITTKIRSSIIADSEINPKKFKVITADSIVYLMGDVVPEQAKKVIRIARSTDDVKRVVKLFKYYHLSDKENM